MSWDYAPGLPPETDGIGDEYRKALFRNQADRPCSMHPHGVFYEKQSEGKAYRDGTPRGPETDDAVPPGETHTCVWPVP